MAGKRASMRKIARHGVRRFVRPVLMRDPVRDVRQQQGARNGW